MEIKQSNTNVMPSIKEIIISLITSSIAGFIIWVASRVYSFSENDFIVSVLIIVIIFLGTVFLLFNPSINKKIASKIMFTLHKKNPQVIYQDEKIKSDILTSINNEVKETNDRKLLYNILNATAINQSYTIIKEEITYSFEKDDFATYKVRVQLEAKEPISSYSFRFAWSGDHGGISIPKLTDNPKNKKFRIEKDLDMVDLETGKKKKIPEDEQGYRYYKVVFGKKPKTPKSGLVDFEYYVTCEGKSRPFLEVSIKDVVEDLSLKVEFSPETIVTNVQKFEFVHSNDDIQFDEPKATIEEVTKSGKVIQRFVTYNINKPFLGGKYEINWDW